MQRQKFSKKAVESAVVEFSKLQERKKELDAKFNEKKADFYKFMSEVLDSGVIGDSSTFDFIVDERGSDGSTRTFNFKTTRIIPTKVKWDTSKLKKKLDADTYRDVVKRDRQLIDPKGLAKYVKSLGGKPSMLWSFFHVTDSVDEKAMDQAFDIGDITQEDVAGCFSVEAKPEFYRVTTREIAQDGEDG